jgi:hypothetical protein
MAEQSTFARRMMAQKLMAEKRDDPFSDSRFFAGKMRPSMADIENPTRLSDMAGPAYGAAATGSLFAPGAGIADVMGYAPDPMQSGQMLPSFGENIGQGNYLDAGLQTLGVAGDVLQAGGAVFPPLIAAGTALKAPRAARVADAAMDAADAAKIDPNEAAGAAMDAAQARYFETGKFEPPTAENPVSIVPPTETEPGIIAFHGSGADFDEFRLEMIGTGEGAQAYGYGLYFTDSEDIAKFYRDAMADRDRGLGNIRIKYKGGSFAEFGDSAAAEADPIKYRMLAALSRQIERPVTMRPMDDPEKVARVAKDELLQSIDRNIEMQRKAFANESASVQATMEDTLLADIIAERDALARIDPADIEVDAPTGKMYKVGLAPKPDELLDYDAPFSAQSKNVQKKLLKAGYEIDPRTSGSGGMILDAIMSNVGREGAHLALGGKRTDARQIASQRMAEAGIPGIKYRAAGSRATTTADEAAERNYVIFDDKAVKILEKYGIVGPVAVTAAGAAAVNRGRNDNDNGGSILPDAGVL